MLTTDHTSVSQQRTLLRCPKKYEYHYVKKIRPRRTDSKFLLGRAVHHFLEHYYGVQIDNTATRRNAFEYAHNKFKEHVSQNFPQDDEAFAQAELAEKMITHYFHWSVENDRFTVVGTEIPFEIPVLQTKLIGVFDGIVELGGKYWILEHKTAAQINTKHVLRDKQVGLYVSAARVLGIPVEGVIYNTLKKGVPQKPALLKRGGLSRALSNNNITFESYIEAIHENGLDYADYQQELSMLEDRENPFFFRELVSKPEYDADQVWKDVEQAEELREVLVQNNIFPRNDTKDCTWDCPFAELCLAEFEGHDTEELFVDKYVYID